MRLKNAIINATLGIMSYIVLMISNFITRAFFVRILGLELVGIESLFKQIISMLAVAELGIGTGLVYKLYKPIIDKDNIKIKKILNFYKQAYKVIAIFIAVFGIILCFFVHYLVKEDFSPIYLGFVFFLFVLDVLASYLYANRKALLIADQKNYLININDASIQFFTMIAQVILLNITKSFVIYMIVKITCRIIGAMFIAKKFNKLYPEIANLNEKDTIDGQEKKELLTNVKAMLCHKIGAFSVNSSASIFITYFVSAVANGIYANYTLITTTVTHLINQLFNGVTASFGDFINSQSKEQIRTKFNILYFLNYVIYSICTVCIFILIEPFIKLWIGEESLFELNTLILLITYFYIFGMRRVILMSKDSAGLFKEDSKMALVEAFVNIILAIILAKLIGVNGVILANIISILLIPMWTQPKIVYNKILDMSVINYYKKYICYLMSTILIIVITYFIANYLVFNNLIIELIAKACVCVVVAFGINIILYRKTAEYEALKKIIMGILMQIKQKLKGEVK